MAAGNRSDLGLAAVYAELDAVYEARGVGREDQRGRGDLVGMTEPAYGLCVALGQSLDRLG